MPFLLAIAALPVLADTLPAHCGPVGAKSYTPPDVTIPAVILNRGTVITVTNANMAINGDTSSVGALKANPGPDGISLQEAVMATNQDPGAWVIQFAPALKGSTIVLDSGPLGGLTFLTGGNVTINGEINGDGQPDITLTSLHGAIVGVYVVSSGNTLHGLALKNFTYGVWISPPQPGSGPPANTGATFSNTTISNLVMTDIQQAGIGVNPPSPYSASSQSTWDHILIIGNTISGNASGPILGMDLELGSTAGDTLQHTTIANNTINIPMPGALAIGFGVGAGLGATNNQALDTLIFGNTIVAVAPYTGIRIATGEGGASANLIDGMQMISNLIRITGPVPLNSNQGGIDVANADGGSDTSNPPVLPIQYSENNIIRNLSMLSNTIDGPASRGIFVQGACCGNRNNTIDGLSVLGNTITGATSFGVLLVSGGNGSYDQGPTHANTLSNVQVHANTIQLVPTISAGCNCYPQGTGISFGGIQVWAGWQEPGNSVNSISIANNEVDTPLVGIGIVGGWGGGGGTQFPPFPSDNNAVTFAQISCNQVDQAPTIGLDYPGIKGIDVTAGLLEASGNHVHVLVGDNLVAGALADAAFFANLGKGASRNAAEWPDQHGEASSGR